MVYFVPRKYKCPKCGFEIEYSKSINYTFLPVSDNGKPYCYKCLIEFIKNNVPEMECKQHEKHQRTK